MGREGKLLTNQKQRPCIRIILQREPAYERSTSKETREIVKKGGTACQAWQRTHLTAHTQKLSLSEGASDLYVLFTVQNCPPTTNKHCPRLAQGCGLCARHKKILDNLGVTCVYSSLTHHGRRVPPLLDAPQTSAGAPVYSCKPMFQLQTPNSSVLTLGGNIWSMLWTEDLCPHKIHMLKSKYPVWLYLETEPKRK